MDIATAVEIGCAVVTGASAICAMTKTPDPATPLGKAYRVIEALGLLVGRAKDSGLVPANPAIDQAERAAVAVAKSVLDKGAIVLLFAAGLGLSACTQVGQVETKVAAFEAKAAPAIAQSCATFHAAEADPLVQLAIVGGTTAADLATGGVPAAGLAVSAIKGFGDAFCTAGPAAGDATSVAQQAAWIVDVAGKLLTAAGAKP